MFIVSHIFCGGATLSRTPTIPEAPAQNSDLNKAIGILLASYTRAINKQQNRSGSLFRSNTKAECITKVSNITPSFYNTEFGASMHTNHPEDEYPQVCFNYIHLNPVKDSLVKQAEDWEFSSYRDYFGLRNGKLVEKDCAKRYSITIQTVI